jgi:ATP-dependent helicase STH1/SNF2
MVKDFSNDPPPTLKITLRQPPPAEKAPSVPPPPPSKQTAAQAQEELLMRIENLKEPRTKRKYSDIFMEAPSKKEYPEYYEFIQRVICLNEIKVHSRGGNVRRLTEQRNVKKGMYKSWGEFEADVELVWSNAFTFNEDGSQVYQDAKKLKVVDLVIETDSRLNSKRH